jgi:hypothetical protein
MITITKYIALILLTTLVSGAIKGQTSFAAVTDKNDQRCKPPISRELFHDYVDAQQKNVLKSDGKVDNQYTPSTNEEVNFLLTQTISGRVDALQCLIETDSTLNDQGKKRYLRGIEYVLKFFITNTATKKINPLVLPEVISAYEKCFNQDKRKQSIDGVVKAFPYEVVYSILKADNITFERNAGYKSSVQEMVLKYCHQYPNKTFAMLSQNADMPFVDSMVRVRAKKYPRQLYDYSQANNRLGNIIRGINDDDFIKTVVKMAKTKDGQQYFCFLDNILKGRTTLEEIDAAKDDSVKYYKLLVKTQMDYAKRLLEKDTAFEFKTLTERLEQKAKINFVNVINGLHDLRNLDIRFRCIQPLSAEELYYLAVTSDGAMYTSSFVKGVFPLMMKKCNNRGDSLLKNLHFDKYRKFIKMAAGFNSLDIFLASFPKATKPGEEDPASTLMKAFVRNLEKSEGYEDGVDVADSYASIAERMRPMAAEMLKNIQENYQRNFDQNNKKGVAIYNILNKLFLSADSTKNIDLAKELGVPSVYSVPYTNLTYDSTEKIAVQLFIYGDKDGRGLFPGLVGMFNNGNWKIDQTNKQWVTITAAKGKPVTLYMNKPLPEETNEDALAQEALCKYLADNKIIPKVTINRGHSYNAPYTIEQMSTASRIVFMGSCGGYRSIHDILQKAPDAHIIGTKQIADAEVNNPFLKLVTEKLRTGSNIEWIPFWKELAKIATDPIFIDHRIKILVPFTSKLIKLL